MKCTRPLTKKIEILNRNPNTSCINKKYFVVTLLLVSIMAFGCSSTKKNTQPDTKRVAITNVSINGVDSKKYKRALAMMEAGDYQVAQELFRQVADDYPELAGPNINMGIITLKQHNYLQAERHFQLAIKSKPNNAEIYNFLGVVYRQQGRFPDARKAYIKALSLDENMAKTYLNLGILNDLYLGNYLEAQKNYKKYQQLKPEDEKINIWLMDINTRIQASAE